jgi:hypothetical protein
MALFLHDKIKLMRKPVHMRINWRRVRLVFLAIAALILPVSCRAFGSPPMITPVVTAVQTQSPLNPEQKQTQLAIHSTATPIPSPTSWAIATATGMPTQTPKIQQEYNPLTGLRLGSPEELLKRPIMVKLANWPRNLRPSNQIINADLVFEYYNGHQTNHLLALYYTGSADKAGPLAPGRLIDARLARHYQAELVVASAPEIVAGVFEKTLPNLVYYRGYAPCPGICTETEAEGGNTVVDTNAIRAFSVKDRPPRTIKPMESLHFSQVLATWDEPALRFSYLYADFSVMDWRYDPDSGKYQLWQEVEDEDGNLTLAPSFDRDSGEAIAFENIIFMMTNYIEYNSTTYDINLREGDPNQIAIFLRDGKLTYGTWYSGSLTEPFSFFVNGEAYPLKPGRSWLTFTTTISRPVSTIEGEWDLTFKLK